MGVVAASQQSPADRAPDGVDGGFSPSSLRRTVDGRRFGTLFNSSLLLIGASGGSYLTTFVRERYFYQGAYGTQRLDHLEVVLSVAAIISNVAGVVLALWWSSGRVGSRRMALIGAVSAAAAAAIALPLPDVGYLLGVMVASSAFLWGSQRAAAAGRQFPALLGAIIAPGLTIACWHWLGIGSPSKILLGYLAGAVAQGTIAVFVGRHTTSVRAAPGIGASLWWPILYMLAVQVDAVLDQIVLLGAGRGWAGADALAFNFLAAATVIVIGPLGAQALAGRFDVRRWRQVIVPTLAVTVGYLVAVPLVLPVLIKGGAVEGAGYHRILVFSLSYGLAIPFSIVWQLRTRAANRDSEQWAAVSRQALLVFGLHSAALVVFVILGSWELVPLATVLSFAIASAWLVRRDSVMFPKAMAGLAERVMPANAID